MRTMPTRLLIAAVIIAAFVFGLAAGAPASDPAVASSASVPSNPTAAPSVNQAATENKVAVEKQPRQGGAKTPARPIPQFLKSTTCSKAPNKPKGGTMDIYNLLNLLILGAILGAVGQGARAVVGLKKQYDAALGDGGSTKDWFSANLLVVSLIIGAIAGCLSIFVLTKDLSIPTDPNSLKLLITSIIAAGYAGTDFIEGFMKTQMPDKTAADKAAADKAAADKAAADKAAADKAAADKAAADKAAADKAAADKAAADKAAADKAAADKAAADKAAADKAAADKAAADKAAADKAAADKGAEKKE